MCLLFPAECNIYIYDLGLVLPFLVLSLVFTFLVFSLVFTFLVFSLFSIFFFKQAQ